MVVSWFYSKKFTLENPGVRKSIFKAAYWFLFDNKPRKKWPKWINTKSGSFSQKHIHQAVYINHATVLLTIDRLHVLTDPVFSLKIGPAKSIPFLSYKRVHLPMLDIYSLPKIDLVLISHNHYDHCDKESILDLYRNHNCTFVVPVGVKNILVRWGVGVDSVVEMPRYNSIKYKEITIHAEDAVHWSGRSALDMNTSHWLSFVLSYEDKKIFFAGDTGFGDHFRKIGEKYKTIDLALLPIGSYEPRWMMREQHMNPHEAVQAMKELGAKKSMAIHFGTFKLSKESHHQPVEDLKNSLIFEDKKIRDNFFIPDIHNNVIILDI
jgi:L-ascorbate metabolism protein UlaG (beta-lactamase superfamily)